MWVVEVNVKGRRFTHPMLGVELLGADRIREAARGAAHRLNRFRHHRPNL